jgi:hypothetical protein
MAKASLTLPNGTVVQIEGTIEEVQGLLAFYGSGAAAHHTPTPPKKTATPRPKRRRSKHVPDASPPADDGGADAAPNLSEIVNLTKTCDEAEEIERQVLDRASQVDRTLLPLYVVHEHLGNRFGLSSGEVSKITTDLGVPVSQPNASRTLSGTAAKYVIGDKVRKKGQAVRYKLSRRGVQYLKAVIGGQSDENAK